MKMNKAFCVHYSIICARKFSFGRSLCHSNLVSEYTSWFLYLPECWPAIHNALSSILSLQNPDNNNKKFTRLNIVLKHLYKNRS